MARDLGEKGVFGLDRRRQLVLDPPEVGLENRELQQRARDGHTVTIGATSRNTPNMKFAEGLRSTLAEAATGRCVQGPAG